MTVFANRTEAGRRLAERLMHLKDADPAVLALPRGGVPVGFEVALALAAPLDLLLVRKIGAPDQPELAVGAVVDGQHAETVVNDDIVTALGLPESYIARESARLLEEIERQRELYLGGRSAVELTRRTAIVVDDGIATGATVRAGLHGVRRARPRRLVLAVPVAPPDTAAALRRDVDEFVSLAIPESFGAIGHFYSDFRQVSDSEVIDMLQESARRYGKGAG